MLFACGPGPTTDPATPAATPSASSTVTPTKPVTMPIGPDCNTKAMAKLTSTITDAGMRSDLDASVAQDEVEPKDATQVVQKLAPKLTACNPQELEGCAYYTTSLDKDGAVTGVDVFVSDALPRDVLDCLAGVLKEARFASVGKPGKMTLPVTFTRTR